MNYKSILILGTATFCLLLMSSCNSDHKQVVLEEIPVKVIHLASHSVVERDVYVGTVISSIEAQLSFMVSGNVKNVYVSQGQTVKHGQLLAELIDENLRYNDQLAQAKLKQAEDGYRRFKALYDNGSLPEVRFVEIQTQLEQAKSMASITVKNLKDAKLYAPFDGVITLRNIEKGETVTPAIPRFTISKIRPLKVKVAIPENEIGNIEIGQKCDISVSAANQTALSGSVIERNLVANRLSHTYEVKIKFDKEPSNVMPGMICNVSLYSNKQSQSMVLPAHVIQITPEGKRFVWCVNNGKANRKEIIIGELLPTGVEIISGLTHSDVVITDGNHKVYNNAKVKVL